MSDNPKKKKLDGKRISQQAWEQAYQRRKNASRKKEVATNAKLSKEALMYDADYLDRVGPVAYMIAGRNIPHRRKLKLAVLKMEIAMSKNPIRGKEPVNLCKEWEEKGKPIFNLALVLFQFNAKVKGTIKRIMNGIDGVCGMPEAVGDV